MVSVCLPSDALLQHLPSYLGFSYLGCVVSLHGCFSKLQPLLLTLDDGYLLTAALPDLQCETAPLGPLVPVLPQLLRPAVSPLGYRSWPREWGGSSQPPPLALDVGQLLSAISGLSQPGTISCCPDKDMSLPSKMMLNMCLTQSVVSIN